MFQPRVLITGGGRGIGRAIALEFARRAWRVAVCARNEAEIAAVAAEVEAAGGAGLAVPLDVTDAASIEACLARVEGAFDGLDVLVNNAGIFEIGPVQELPEESWRAMLEVNLTGPFRVTRAALPALRRSERGHIFNVSSTAGQQGYPGSTAYCASKYGLRGFGDALREELREHGIRVSTVYPDATDTSIFDDVPGDWDRSTMNLPADVSAVIWQAYQREGDSEDLQVPPPAGRPAS